MTQEITGLSVGDAAPPFVLQAGDGQAIRLTDVLSCRAAILVFIRGTW
jgi:peroxiredoxin